MILSDLEIKKEIERGTILIEPFRDNCLGTNSYDLHLGRFLSMYEKRELDVRHQNSIIEVLIPEDGYLLYPNNIYLGSTEEYTETHVHAPNIVGKSSLGRLGLSILCSNGIGDVGYCNTWTIELTVVQPVRIYAGMPIAELVYFMVEGDVSESYIKKANSKYIARSMKPMPSHYWKEGQVTT